ncbi:MAG: DUF4199 domain-containing protein [Rubrivivax sp.]
MNNPVLRHGLVAGAVLSAMMLATIPFLDRIGFDLGTVIGYTTMVVAFLMVYFGTRAWRDQRCGGRIGFWRAFGVGMAIVSVATVCYVVTWEVLYFGLMPDFGDRYAAYALEQARKAGATEAQLAVKAREMAEFRAMYANPLVNIAFTLLEPLPVGLVFALGSAGLLSRQRTA